MSGFDEYYMDTRIRDHIDEDRMYYLGGKSKYHNGEPCPTVTYRDDVPNRQQFQEACGWNYAEWEELHDAL